MEGFGLNRALAPFTNASLYRFPKVRRSIGKDIRVFAAWSAPLPFLDLDHRRPPTRRVVRGDADGEEARDRTGNWGRGHRGTATAGEVAAPDRDDLRQNRVRSRLQATRDHPGLVPLSVEPLESPVFIIDPTPECPRLIDTVDRTVQPIRERQSAV